MANKPLYRIVIDLFHFHVTGVSNQTPGSSKRLTLRLTSIHFTSQLL